jgi:hypothetical protein
MLEKLAFGTAQAEEARLLLSPIFWVELPRLVFFEILSRVEFIKINSIACGNFIHLTDLVPEGLDWSEMRGTPLQLEPAP